MTSRWQSDRKRCPVCGAALPEQATGRPARYCTDAHRQAAQAARRRVRSLVSLVLRVQAGEAVDPTTPLLGLVREVVQTETARLRAEQQAGRLPCVRATLNHIDSTCVTG